MAKIGEIDNWQKLFQNALALIIVLDQFSRNIFRNSPQAFATDAKAVEVAKFAINKNSHHTLSADRQAFLYMPLMHSENK